MKLKEIYNKKKINKNKKYILPKASAIALPTSPPPAIVISTFSVETVASDGTEYEENRTDIKDRRSNNNCLIFNKKEKPQQLIDQTK
jgi:hypothetical protein